MRETGDDLRTGIAAGTPYTTLLMDTSSGDKGGKKWCGFPRKRVVCGLATLVVIAAAIIVIVVLTRPPEDIATQEKSEEDAAVTAGELTILRTAALSGTAAQGTLSLLRVTADNSSFLALSDFLVADSDCSEFELRLDDGLEVVLLTADIVGGTATDFTEPLDADFDPGMFDQVSGIFAAFASCATYLQLTRLNF